MRALGRVPGSAVSAVPCFVALVTVGAFLIPLGAEGGTLPPDSDPGGPYTFCLGRPDLQLVLDGTFSSDSDGTLVFYEWDWTPPLHFIPPDATGSTVDATAAFGVFSPGIYDVALRVTDNDTMQAADFTMVTVFSASDCPIPDDDLLFEDGFES
jgi:K319-like protein